MVTYGYNNAGQLVGMTLPSGQQIGYSYINNRVATITINGQTLLHGAVTMPFGPLSSWLWGNGLFTLRNYDRDGRVTSWEFRNGASILRKEQTFDAASRITAVNNPNQIGVNQNYQYDLLDRITVAQTGTPPTHTQQFTYDSVRNRLNITIDNSITNSAYAMTTNQLQMLSGSLPATYLLGSGTWTFTYNNANRLSTALNGSTVIATYRVNAQGQRVSKNVGGAITYFVYDEVGHVLGEYDRTGGLIEETVWLEDLPVATLRPTGIGGIPTSINIYYVHADHLGSARAVTRPSDNKLMWQWDNLDPFGANPPNENPSGQGTFKYNLRFPGQYYDSETGTNYNYFRDYDPAIGRYLESDPIGLDGGVNTFAYALNAPIKRKDFFGLDTCGSGFSEGLVPDNPFGFPFSHCCNRHDNCYDDCFSKPSQSECDETFCQCMLNRCGRYSGSVLRLCTDVANAYCWAVKRSGSSAFVDARKKCCR
jgi:RHS repeat-associated protein